MASLLEQIFAKPNWQTKINDATIVAKWREELVQQGISEMVLNIALQLLEATKNPSSRNDYYADSKYPWHLQVGILGEDLWRGCRGCECMTCSGDEHILQELEEYEEDDEEYREIERRLKKYKKVKCKCINAYVDENLDYLRASICYGMKGINKTLKQRFIEHVEAFENRKTSIDYHPGSNDQMRDIIHPSLYCYVKGVTSTTAPASLLQKTSILQWIPAEFSVIRDQDTQEPIRTEIRSYINNLGDRNDPVNAALYQDIEEIFTAMVSGFESVITQLKNDNCIMAYQGDERSNEDIKLGDCQVIVKIARCELSEEKRDFAEGSWHLEGIDAEKIIATGIYYYDVKNIEPSYLRFRSTLAPERIHYLRYPQNCHEYVRLHYGLSLEKMQYSAGANTVIKLGRIPTKENLCVFFPNTLQHRVSKIRLREGCTTGSRSILVFFLVNPFEKTISTADIPVPQQDVMSLENAKMYREMLMFERKYEYGEQDKFHQRLHSLCEH